MIILDWSNHAYARKDDFKLDKHVFGLTDLLKNQITMNIVKTLKLLYKIS